MFRFGDDEKLLVNNIRRVMSDVLAYGPEGVLRLSQVNYFQCEDNQTIARILPMSRYKITKIRDTQKYKIIKK